jgi:excisionase family DNA binding protein
MSAIVDALLAELDDNALDALADALAPRLATRLSSPDAGWLNAKDAAAYLACTPDRVYDLVGLGKLAPCRDGRRLLFQQKDLDAYLESA